MTTISAPHPRQRLSAEAVRALALVLVCGGTVVNFGAYGQLGMAMLGLGAVLALAAPRFPSRPLRDRRAWALLVVALGLEGVYAATGISTGNVSILAAAAVTVLAALAVLTPARAVARAALGAGAAGFALVVAGGWRWGMGNLDVFDIVVRGGRELAHGVNPYGNRSLLTDQEIAGHWVKMHFAFPYGPALLLLTLPFALLGDTRPACALAALGIAASILALARRAAGGPGLTVAAALCLTFPLAAKMVDYTWVDIELMAPLLGFLALRGRNRPLAVALLGLGLAIKPATVLPLLLPLLVWSPRARREMLGAVGVAAVLVLPFVVITGPQGFYDAVAGFFVRLPPRTGSLTVDSLLLTAGHPALPLWTGVCVVAAAAVWLVPRRPRDLSDTLAAGAALTTVSFLVAKQAFFNYYFDPALLLLVSLLVRGVPVEEGEEVAIAVTGREVMPVAAVAR